MLQIFSLKIGKKMMPAVTSNGNTPLQNTRLSATIPNRLRSCPVKNAGWTASFSIVFLNFGGLPVFFSFIVVNI